jgi:hypothetical protein
VVIAARVMSNSFLLLRCSTFFGIGNRADVLSCAVDGVVASNSMMAAMSVFISYIILRNCLNFLYKYFKAAIAGVSACLSLFLPSFTPLNLKIARYSLHLP